MITQEQFSSLRKGDKIFFSGITLEYTVDEFDKKTDRIMSTYYKTSNNTKKNYTGDIPYTYQNMGNQIERIIKLKIDNWKKVITNEIQSGR